LVEGIVKVAARRLKVLVAVPICKLVGGDVAEDLQVEGERKYKKG